MAEALKNDVRRAENSAVSEAGRPSPAALVRAPSRPGQGMRRKRLIRVSLFAALPVVLIIGIYEYCAGGQTISIDNAYVTADIQSIATDVSGTIAEVAVKNNQKVKTGDLLFRLKPDSFQIAYDGAVAQLGTVRNQILTLKAAYEQGLAAIAQAEADIPYFTTVLNRQKALLASNAAAQAAYDDAAHNLEAARQRLAVARTVADADLAQLGNDANQPVEENPFYKQAASAVDSAKRDLDDTVVRAPFDGYVANVDTVQPGAYLPAARPAFSLVSSQKLWITANPKETDLTWVRPGQPVSISVDTYPDVTWKGKVESISPASGGSFSLLPAQNTSGNWVKVVQRIPVRISVEPTEDQPPLRVGMSVIADIDTGHARGLPSFITSLFPSSDKK